ncbi:glutathione S-transferase family protein [Ramlibacter sp. PS4R-6]|uniref:glutathione S-transferase family protein n=1 Tax=Ramlibacter sp. PS4R-6 TaxID=3133438 RepID=UPI0030B16F74
MYRLHCFAQSGNCFKVAFALEAMKQPWEAVPMDFAGFVAGTTRDPSWRASVNEMGEAPVLEDDGKRLTQSAAILLRLAERHGRFGGRDEDERFEVMRWLFFDNHKFTSYFATWRFTKSFGATAPDPTIEKFLRGRIDNALGIVEKHLATQPYMVGDAPTLADISMCAYLLYPKEEHGYDIAATHPNIAKWLDRVRAIEGWQHPYDLLPGERVAPKW